MAKTLAFDTPFRKGDKVTATVDLPNVPAGTTGRVKLVNGLTWTRYWVFFDNGVDLGSIDQKALVRTKQWDDYQVHRLEAATRATAPAAAPSGDGDGGAAAPAAAPGAGSGVPEHLLERTRKRREQLGLS
jgi:hypothetical protein